jgi:hypothetical protein
VEYINGFSTSFADRVRIVDNSKDQSEGVVVFSEDAEPEIEKPVMSLCDGKLVISCSRDAYVLMLKENVAGISVLLTRRTELVGRKPIGSLIKALQESDRVWNRDDLTAKVWQTCQMPIYRDSKSDMDQWFRLLEDKRVIITDDTLHNGIQVREIALTCIAEILGRTSVLDDLPDQETLGTGNSGKPKRYYIKKINDQYLPKIEMTLHARPAL